MIFGSFDLESTLLRVLAVLIAMSVHEMAHSLVSWWMGDKTAAVRGRLSLNPLAHIDWTGFLCLLVFGFGWAKPVPINPGNYKDEKAGIIWTSFAGPASNFILSFVLLFIYVLLFWLSNWAGWIVSSTIGWFVIQLLIVTARLSLGFGIFNLIPIPPLDGSKIFWSFLPDDLYYKYINGNMWWMLVLFALLATGLLSQPLYWMQNTVFSWMLNFWSMVFGY